MKVYGRKLTERVRHGKFEDAVRKQSGGRVGIDTEIGRGTSIQLYLPAVRHES